MAMAESKTETLERLYDIIDSDSTATTFQTLGQYRAFLKDTVRGMIKQIEREQKENRGLLLADGFIDDDLEEIDNLLKDADLFIDPEKPMRRPTRK